MTGANWMYVNSHFVVTTTFLIWLYIARNHAYYYVRNMFMIAMGLALVGYMAYPTAPPRYLPEWGFTDTVAAFVGEAAEQSANVLYNPFAAVPSMHVAFALMIAIPAIKLVKPAKPQGGLGPVPRRGHLRRGRHRQPLLARRRLRRHGRCRLGLGRLVRARTRPPRGVGLAHRPRRSGGVVVQPPREQPPDGRGDARAHSRSPDRVAPHAQRHLDGRPVGQPDRRRARHPGGVLPRGHRLRRRLGDGHARRALLAHVGQGHAVRRLPRLEPRPDGGGHRAGGGGRVLRQAGRRDGRGRRGAGRAVLADGQLHPRPRRSAGRGVQGGDCHARRCG